MAAVNVGELNLVLGVQAKGLQQAQRALGQLETTLQRIAPQLAQVNRSLGGGQGGARVARQMQRTSRATQQQAANVQRAQRAWLAYRSSLGGADRAAAQLTTAQRRLAQAVAQGIITQRQYRQELQRAQRTFTTARANAADLRQNMQRLATTGDRLRSGLALATRALGVFGVALGAQEVGRFAADTVQAAAAIQDAANVADVSAGNLQRLRFAFTQLADVTENQVDLALQRFNRRMGLAADGSGEAAQAYDALGVALRDTEGNMRRTDAVLEEVLRELAAVESDARRSALASRFFGEEAGPRLAAALRQGMGAFNSLRDEAEVFSDEALRTASDLDDRWQEFAQTMSVRVRSAILDAADAFDRFVSGDVARLPPDLRVQGRIHELRTELDRLNKQMRLPAQSTAVMESLRRQREEAVALLGVLERFQAASRVHAPVAEAMGRRAQAAQAAQRQAAREAERTAARQAQLDHQRELAQRHRLDLIAEEARRWEEIDRQRQQMAREADQLRQRFQVPENVAGLVPQRPLDPVQQQRLERVTELRALNEEYQRFYDQIAALREADVLSARQATVVKRRIARQKILEEGELERRHHDEVQRLREAEMELARRAATDRQRLVSDINAGIQRQAGFMRDAEVAAGRFSSELTGGLADAAVQGESLTDVLASLGTELASLLVQLQMMDAVSAGMGLLNQRFGVQLPGPPATGSAANMQGVANMVPMRQAQGGAFAAGRRLTRYAQGGVVTQPTVFPMANGGVGLMGERGAEGVLPLARVGGDLGVNATGLGTVLDVDVNVINQGGAALEVVDQRATVTRAGHHQIDVLVRSSVHQGLNDGSFDRAMASNYGVRRRGR